MKYIRKILLVLVVITIASSLLSGCSKKENILSENNLGAERGNPGEMRNMQNMKIGKIISVNGDTVEILPAKIPERGNMPGGGQGGERGQRPQNGQPVERGQRDPNAPQGERAVRDPNAPQGERAPGGNGNFMQNLEFDDQKISITVPEDIKVISGGRDSQQEISVSDLKADDIISYTEENEIITSIRLVVIEAE